MQLTIDGETVDYSLEHEKTLGDVVGGVRTWLAAEGFLITGLSDGSEDFLKLPSAAWAGREIASVERLEVSVTRTADMKVEHWRTVETWFGILSEELSSQPPGGEPDPLNELLSDLPKTLEGFTANPFLPPGSDAIRRFSALFSGQTPASIRAWPAERMEQGSAVVEELGTLVRSRLSEVERPADALGRRRDALRDRMPGLSEVSVLLQTGKDRAAMDIVIGFTDTVQSLMDLLPFLPPDQERARALSGLVPTLRELVAAFTNRDSVLIGDLLEYEVAPRLERILPLLERVV
jgi:hypothetical protein